MIQTVLFLKGLPGSGKSTFAKELVDANPDKWVRVNKDGLRWMLHEYKWSRGREKIVEQTQLAIARSALENGKSVIVDNTHMSPRHMNIWIDLAKEYKVEFELMSFDLPIEDCIERDQKRGVQVGCVGKDVILRMFYQHMCDELKKNPSLPNAYIVDIDGTIATMFDRGAYDWDKVGNDKPNESVIKLVNLLHQQDNTIILLSGRDGSCKEQTIKWLADNSVSYDQLYMREAGNMEKDTKIKRELYEEHVKGKYNIEAVFDDRPCMVRLWRSMGLFVFDCGNGIEF